MKIGQETINGFKVGADDVVSIYLGSTNIYTSGDTPTPTGDTWITSDYFDMDGGEGDPILIKKMRVSPTWIADEAPTNKLMADGAAFSDGMKVSISAPSINGNDQFLLEFDFYKTENDTFVRIRFDGHPDGGEFIEEHVDEVQTSGFTIDFEELFGGSVYMTYYGGAGNEDEGTFTCDQLEFVSGGTLVSNGWATSDNSILIWQFSPSGDFTLGYCEESDSEGMMYNASIVHCSECEDGCSSTRLWQEGMPSDWGYVSDNPWDWDAFDSYLAEYGCGCEGGCDPCDEFGDCYDEGQCYGT